MKLLEGRNIDHAVSVTLIMTLCLVSTIDTGLFVYASLSKSLAFGLCAIVFSLHFIGFKAIGHDLRITPFTIIVLLWMVYILSHGRIVFSEVYRQTYLLAGLSFMLTLSFALRIKAFTFGLVENGLLLMAAIHLFYIMWQRNIGYNPLSEYFPVSGSNENPNITSMYLVGCVPMLIERIVKGRNKAIWTGFAVTIGISLIFMNCRTAYLGLCCIATVWHCSSCRTRRWFRELAFCKRIAIFIVMVCSVAACSYKLYQMKQASADGRILVWKLSAEMAKDCPQGYGYGMFEKEYNLRQAKYFSENKVPEREKSNASFVAMPYNDYLENCIEGGFVGLALYVAFYAIGIGVSIRRHDKKTLSVFFAFAVMSCVNFVYTAIQPWLLLLCYGAVCGSEMDGKGLRLTGLSKVLFLLPCLSVVACLLWVECKTTYSQMKLGGYEKRHAGSVDDLTKLSKNIETSEAYWRILAGVNMKKGLHKEAIGCLGMAMKYSSHPSLFYMSSRCHAAIGDWDKHKKDLELVADMEPNRIRPKVYLMRYYANVEKDKRHAMDFAQEIMETPMKVVNAETLSLKKEAENFLERKW